MLKLVFELSTPQLLKFLVFLKHYLATNHLTWSWTCYCNFTDAKTTPHHSYLWPCPFRNPRTT